MQVSQVQATEYKVVEVPTGDVTVTLTLNEAEARRFKRIIANAAGFGALAGDLTKAFASDLAADLGITEADVEKR